MLGIIGEQPTSNEVSSYVHNITELLANGKKLSFKNKKLWHFEAFYNYVILPKWGDKFNAPTHDWLGKNRFWGFEAAINKYKCLSGYEINSLNDFWTHLGLNLSYGFWSNLSLDGFIEYYNNKILPVWGDKNKAPTIDWLINNDFGGFFVSINHRRYLSSYKINSLTDFWDFIGLGGWSTLSLDGFIEYYNTKILPKWKNPDKAPTNKWLKNNDFGGFFSAINARKYLSRYGINSLNDFWSNLGLELNNKHGFWTEKSLIDFIDYYNTIILPVWGNDTPPTSDWLKHNFNGFLYAVGDKKLLSKYGINSLNDFWAYLGLELNVEFWAGKPIDYFVDYYTDNILPFWGDKRIAPSKDWLIINGFSGFVSAIDTQKHLFKYNVNGLNDFWLKLGIKPNEARFNPLWRPWQDLLGEILKEFYSSIKVNKRYKNSDSFPDFVIDVNGFDFAFDAKCNPWQGDIYRSTIPKYTKLPGNKRLFICYLDGRNFDKFPDKKLLQSNDVPVVFTSGFELVNQLVPKDKQDFYFNKINELVDKYRGVDNKQTSLYDFL